MLSPSCSDFDMLSSTGECTIIALFEDGKILAKFCQVLLASASEVNLNENSHRQAPLAFTIAKPADTLH